MKVVIIGGGIAGLSLGVFLQKNKHKVKIIERDTIHNVKGNAFLMHSLGYLLLDELNNEKKIEMPGALVDTFLFKNQFDEPIKHMKMAPWQCIKRTELIAFLYKLFPEENMQRGKTFSHFIYEDEKAIAAVFTDGTEVYGDIFIGADGSNSYVRSALFGTTPYTQIKVKEILGNAHFPELVDKSKKTFTKYQSNKEGLAFGYIPTSKQDFVWYMQYDSRKDDILTHNPDDIKKFCLRKMAYFSDDIKQIIEHTNFEGAYVWNTRDFDVLPTFSKQNVVLIGDAAHLALPFTSAGTTNAIIDAKILSICLQDTEDYAIAFSNFYTIRAEVLGSQLQLGRDLQKSFLSPKDNTEIKIPLISPNSAKVVNYNKIKPIKILYYTDPICSTCWVMQPDLRKLKLEYDRYLDIEYHMGGLLDSWTNYNRGDIKIPTDAKLLWDDLASQFQMPLDGDIWLEDPLVSSYPPSIAFKAAQLQNIDKALLFFRRIREMVFVEKKNIVKWEHIADAAFEVGLDIAKLHRDFFSGTANELFLRDLNTAKELQIQTLPTLVFLHENKHKGILVGVQKYEILEQKIMEIIPAIKKKEVLIERDYLFNEFSSMTEKEYAFLNGISMANAQKGLSLLEEKGILQKTNGKNGNVWTKVLTLTGS